MSNILIVDDSPVMRMLVKKGLKQAGYTFTSVEAGNGVEGLQKFDGNTFDLVLTDWNMPQMNGLEFVKEIRKRPDAQHLPIILITTETSPEKIKQIVDAGANGCVSKPITPIKLRAKIDSYIKQ
ncbi:MAG: response regulator [Candidatus Aureabacteria bacterium]|nr:response regulator [Candidatus Auribacterota bacterium]